MKALLIACICTSLAAAAPPIPNGPAAAFLNVKEPRFGAVGDGITDDAPAINRALAAARKTGEYGHDIEGTPVYLPPGIYRVDAPLDLNGGQFNLVGAGAYQTVLRGNTGDHTAVLELVGSGFCKISGLLIDDLLDALPAAERHPSSIGVLLARVDAPQNISDYNGPRFAAQSWWNNLEDVAIRLGTRPEANGGHGTCAYYNFCSEVSGWHNCYLQGDTAAVITAANIFGVQMKTVRNVEWRPGAPERMRMWGGESSMTVVRASGANGLMGITGPALIIGGSDISIDSCIGHLGHQYLPKEPGRWPRYAIEFTSMAHNFAYRGSIEGYAGALHLRGAQVSGLDLRAYMDMQPIAGIDGAETDSVPVIMLDSRDTESPPGSGKFTRTGSRLIDSQLHPATTPNTTGVIGRLIDTTADAAHVIDGNHITLGNLNIRLRNAWSNSSFRGNMASSTLPVGSKQFDIAAGASKSGNLLTAANGIETDAFLTPPAAQSLPAATPEHRGQMVRLEGDAAHPDGLYICEKDAAGNYAWRKL